MFSADFSIVAGAFALSFIIHPVVSPLLKKNIEQSKNNRDLFLGYALTAVIYAFVGVVGAFLSSASNNLLRFFTLTNSLISNKSIGLFSLSTSTPLP